MLKNISRIIRILIEFFRNENERHAGIKLLLDSAVVNNQTVWIYMRHGEGGYTGTLVKNPFEDVYNLIDSKGGILCFHHSSVSMVYTPHQKVMSSLPEVGEKKSLN